ncbi:hypothetical protein G9A89_012303 [Geosiphon pyriformis]|nr:hypothetical protein G9A89_012303 [Geosiphon pyriformis]
MSLIVRKISSLQKSKAVCLFDVWSTLNNKRASKVCTMFNNSKSRKSILQHLSKSRVAKDILIRKAINKCIENFSSNKGHMIKNVLERLFKKVVLNYLIVNDELILELKEIKFTVDVIIEKWTRKQVASNSLPVCWSNQYVPLSYIYDNAFSDIIKVIGLDEFLLVIKELSNRKAVGISGIPNELWKHEDTQILSGLLDILNMCLKLGAPYDWKDTLTNIRPIALVETARKILSKVFSDRISLACSKFNVLCKDNFSVLRGMSTQTLIFIIGSIIENALKKNKELWLSDGPICETVIMDFSLIDGYTVHDKLNQGKKIFYDSLFCEIKRHKQLCGYRLNLKFFMKSSKANPKSNRTFFFVVGVFINNTIWVRNCLAATQHILDIINEFFLINNIAINMNKMIIIPINQETKESIIGYRLQFNCVSKSVCEKWDKVLRKRLKLKINLPKDFLNEALYHPELYGLRTFKQVLAENLLAGLVMFTNAGKILIPIKLLIDSMNCFLADATCALKLCNLLLGILNILSFDSYLGVVKSLKRYGVVFADQILDKHIPVWFVFLVKFVNRDGLSNDMPLFPCSVLADFLCDFGYVNECLLSSGLGSVTIFTDGSVKNFGSLDARDNATTYFPDVNASIRVKMNELLSSTLVELQAIVLALNQASLNMYNFGSSMSGPNFHDKCWIKKKHICHVISRKSLSITWNKVKDYSGIVGNKYANFYADATTIFKSFLSLVIFYCFLNVEDRPVSENAYYIAKKLFNAAKCVGNVISVGFCDYFDKARTFCVWHPDGKIKFGYTSTVSAALWLYFIKALHHQLPCGLVEDSNHVFSCAYNNTLLEVSADGNMIADSLYKAGSFIDLYTVLAKGFVLKSWVADTVDYLGADFGESVLVVNFVCHFAKSHRSAIWLPMAKLKSYYEKHNLLSCNSSSVSSISGLSSVWSTKTIQNFGFRLGIHVCFELHLCLTKSDFGFLYDVSVIKNLNV